MKLNGKTALITAGGRGFGQAIAIAYSQTGARVAVAVRNADEVAETV